MSEPISEKTLLQAAQGDTMAFRQIVLAYQAQAFQWAFRLCGSRDDAQDLVQEAFIRIWKNLPKYHQQSKFSTWLYKIIFNLYLDFKKSAYQQKRFTSSELNPNLSDTQAADQQLSLQELQLQLLHAAAKLSPKQQAAFTLLDMEGLSVSEACEVLSLTAEQLKSNLYYARQKIHQSIQVYLKDPLIKTS